MKQANLVFHFFQVKKYQQLCEGFHERVNNGENQHQLEKLTREGNSTDYYKDEAKKSVELQEKLKSAIKQNYYTGNSADEISEDEVMACIHKEETSCSEKKTSENEDETGENQCAVHFWPHRGRMDTLENFRLRDLKWNSLPKFQTILGCQMKDIERQLKRKAEVFNESLDSRLIDDNDRHSKDTRSFTMGVVRCSSFLDSIVRRYRDHNQQTEPRKTSSLVARDHTRRDTSHSVDVCSTSTDNTYQHSLLDESFGETLKPGDPRPTSPMDKPSTDSKLNSPLSVTEIETLDEKVFAFPVQKAINMNMLERQQSIPAVQRAGDLKTMKSREGAACEKPIPRAVPATRNEKGEKYRTTGKQIRVFENSYSVDPWDLIKSNSASSTNAEMKLVIASALMGSPVFLTQEAVTESNKVPLEVSQLLNFYLSFAPNASSLNVYWLQTSNLLTTQKNKGRQLL